MSQSPSTAVPEHNVTGHDYESRGHFRYQGPLIDIHSHVFQTRPSDPVNGPLTHTGPDASLEQAATMLEVALEFGIEKTYTMAPADDIELLRERFGERIGFNAMINKKAIDEPDDIAYRQLDRFLGLGVTIIKFWAAPRGRERGLVVDAPWRIESARRAIASGIRVFMVHVGDPDRWFQTNYADSTKYGTKPEQYLGLERLLRMFPEAKWIGAHMGGDPEHPEHLQELFETFPNFYVDTSATKWIVREVSPRRAAIHQLMCRYPDRFLFGSDLVTRHHLPREHYVSRYWCQRTLWESAWEGPSPIADPDHISTPNAPTPPLLGLKLPMEVLQQVYYDNARGLFPKT